MAPPLLQQPLLFCELMSTSTNGNLCLLEALLSVRVMGCCVEGPLLLLLMMRLLLSLRRFSLRRLVAVLLVLLSWLRQLGPVRGPERRPLRGWRLRLSALLLLRWRRCWKHEALKCLRRGVIAPRTLWRRRWMVVKCRLGPCPLKEAWPWQANCGDNIGPVGMRRHRGNGGKDSGIRMRHWLWLWRWSGRHRVGGRGPKLVRRRSVAKVDKARSRSKM